MIPRGRLFWKYVIVFVALVSGALLASGLLEIYFSYQENKAALAGLQREKAAGAAARIESFIKEIEHHIGWTTQPQLAAPSAALEQRRVDYLRLLRQVPPITELSHLDANGREQLRVSRLAMDVIGSQTDFSADPKFSQARAGKTYHGPVYFRKESEPYMTIAMPQSGGAGVTVAEVNLKFIWDVVSQIKIGKAGRAFVIDGRGALIAHPDISLVLQKTTMASFEQVQAALAGPAPTGRPPGEVVIARDLQGRQVLTAHSMILPLRWAVFAEQPLEEAFEPIRASVQRTILLVLVGVALAVGASLVLARRMVRPIRALQEGAAKIGAGEMGHRLELRTGDELEALADQFNRMTAQLQESYATLEQRVVERTLELTEALEQQTATAEILRVISSSPTDVQPVFDAIVQRAARLCEASHASLYRREDDLVRCMSTYGQVVTLNPGDTRPLRRGSISGRVILDRKTIHIADSLADADTESPDSAAAIKREGIRTGLGVPLLREGLPIGAIVIRRTEVRPFSEKQIRLLETFADQAVIAIENVRLFTELQQRNRDVTEALEQQTATAEILRVISSSPTDIQPVLNAVVESAAPLSGSSDATIFRVDEDVLRLAAHHGSIPALYEGVEGPIPLERSTVNGRAAVDRQTVHVIDLQAEAEEFPEGSEFARRLGWRSHLAVPLLRESVVIGVLGVRRVEARPFTDKQIELLKTFADQAVIAIENVRLFKELEARNRDLTEALEQQTATSEILRVISSSPTDVQPIFDTIVASAGRLCGARFGALYRFDGELTHLAAHHNLTSEVLEILQRLYPARPARGQASGRAILSRAVAELRDVPTDAEYQLQEFAAAGGWRSMLAVPMLRNDGSPIGAIVIYRSEAGPFPEQHVELLKTFADQAVIAIENVRLFTELQQRNREITEALEQQTATAEILRVISQSPTDLSPVFDSLLANALRLCRAEAGILWLWEEAPGIFRPAAAQGAPEAYTEFLRRAPLRPASETGLGRMATEKRTVHIADVAAEDLYHQREPLRVATVEILGARTFLAVPMLREGELVGAFTVYRQRVEPFTDRQIALIQTFADQAVIAIENVRLFTELQARTRDLARSLEEVRGLSEVSQTLSSTLNLRRVLDSVAEHAVKLSGGDACGIFEVATGRGIFVASHNLTPEFLEAVQAAPVDPRRSAIRRATETGQPVQIPDIAGAEEVHAREIALREGYRAVLAVPMGGENVTRGIVLFRRAPGSFDERVVTLLTTLANQSKVAIDNARLFQEIEEKSRQLEVANRHKSEFLANMSHELRTPLNAIIGFSEVLVERMFGEVNEKQDEYLRDIYSSGRHLLSLINDILDLSKIEAGRMELELTTFNLPMAVDNAVTLVKTRADNHAITLDVAIDPRLGDFAGDERKFKQILVNLLSNAVKFTPEGGRVSVRAGLADGSVEVSVTDTGIGIAAADQAAIFEEFRQAGTDHAGRREGTGLGLTLTRKFVELHGGTIGVKSEVGRGSTFTFTLPVRPAPAG